MDAKEKAAALWAAVKGNGCSDVPDWNDHLRGCCNRHDCDYSTHTDETGEPITRAQADKRLRQCMGKEGRTWFGRRVLSITYWLGVRVFGRKFWRRCEAAGDA